MCKYYTWSGPASQHIINTINPAHTYANKAFPTTKNLHKPLSIYFNINSI